MHNYLRNMVLRIFPLVVFCLIAFSGWTQNFQNGVRKGLIKVKFSPTMSSTLSKMAVNGQSRNSAIGSTAFDQVAQTTATTNIKRLFPYDARNEAKLRKHGLHLWYTVEIGEHIDPKAAVAQFKQLAEVTTAEVSREKVVAPFTATLYTPGPSTFDALPFNDPMLKDQWHYNNTRQTGYGDADINLFEAWTKTAGASDIVVAVHDQGVDVNHKDLKANMWVNVAEQNGKAGVDDDNNGYIDDINGYNFASNKGAIDPQFHATHVAGTIAAVNNNGIGVSGIAGGSGNGDGVKIMSLEIFGDAITENTYVYAANNGAVISQNSWGYTEPGFFEQSVLDAIDYFIWEAGDYPGSPMKGGIVIFAAGNSNLDGDWYPGYHPTILSVASIGPEWKKAAYSNYGDWVEVSAPGGDQVNYGTKNGVLSTYPKDQYAYLQGTSMACPHVSGIAALALANRTHQLTNAELWNKLVTGVVSIEQYNPDYIGKLGSGSLDAALAIQNDQGIAPAKITDLAVTGIAQEFATLAWKVPADTDDKQPLTFQLYVHKQPISAANLSSATKIVIKNDKIAGSNFAYEVDELLGLTTYYFAITSTDRWGNTSVLSNAVTAQTNEGPTIAVDENSQSIAIEIDVATSPSATHDLTILNQGSGILRWDHFMRHKNTELSFNSAALSYPTATNKKALSTVKVGKRNTHESKTKLRSTEPVPSAYTAIEKSLASYVTDIVGENDITITNSAGARFFVNESEGFNLTQVQMYLKHDPAKGPVIVEIYKGSAPVKNNLIYAQEYSNYGTEEQMAYITLDEQLYFESGSTFWIAFHVPSGNLYPLGLGPEREPSASANCFMSFNLGSTWAPLEMLLNSEDYAWGMTAASYNPYLGTYLTLEPGSGDVAGNSEEQSILTATAETLINGSYSANLVLTSNDAKNQQLRIPISVTVSGHQPKIRHVDIADFGSVFEGTSKSLELVLENVGYGNFNDPEFTISNPQFEMVGYAPGQIEAREEVTIKVKFSPTVSGNINGVLDFTNGDQSYQISLFGLGAETSKVVITPESQTKDNIAIGDVVNAQITVENTGAYPLKYFIPGFDSKGVSENWPTPYHSYGYKLRSNYSSETNPIDYRFQDISTTGVNITELLKSDEVYASVDMGFEFPYYGEKMKTLYVAQKGFTVFNNSVNPINTPSLNNSYNPKGYISLLGGYFNYIEQGSIFYQVEADRVIVQYSNVSDGINVGEEITAQMVLFANGDIRFYYDHMGYSEYNQQYLTLLIEDLAQKDGIMIHNWEHPLDLHDGLALGLDYPGPNIITHVDNGSGILAPGSSANVNIELSTESLVEGEVNRYINFISNDPSHAQTSALVKLNVTSGGTAQPIVSTEAIEFGDVFQGAVRSGLFTIKNPGSASVNITGMTFTNNDFTLAGDQPTSIKPGLYKKYEIQVPTSTLATLEDWLTINYADGSHDVIHITATVVPPPAINVDLSVLQETLAYGEKSSHSLTIENPGQAPLEFVAAGTQWLSFDVPMAPASGIPAYTYAFEKHNDGSAYQWIDVRKTGTQMSFGDVNNKEEYWRNLTLPFPVQFYGRTYNEFKIGENGIISFEADPDVMNFPDHIPTSNHEGAYLMPYWTFGGFNTTMFRAEDVGIFYQFYDDKIIITWSYLINNFGGMGDPISAQVLIYKNGTMKFQYKVEEGGSDQTSVFTSIGLQENSNNGVSISDQLPVAHGKGLAFFVVPAQKHIIQPGETLTGNININAENVYGGSYSSSLKIQTNVPGSERIEKPVELTVTGEAILSIDESVDFGKKMITYEQGSPVANYVDFKIANTGSAELEISGAQMTDGTQALSLQLWTLVDSEFGPEWRWADISELYAPWAWPTPTFQILPGDQLKARASFAPSVAGEYTDELVLITNVEEKHIVFKGSSVEPPLINVDATQVEVVMNTLDETTDRSIVIDNLNGKSDLEYEVSIDFGRANKASTESMAKALSENQTFSVQPAERFVQKRVATAYSRILKYTSKDAADAHAGTGGGEPLTLATKYNAGPQGFNLSHVETWFRAESLTEGKVNVEIRAGGTSIADALTLTEGSTDFTGTGDDTRGGWYQVALNETVGIYPNEDFYVIVTLPMGIARPQGVVNDEETVPGRYYYESDGAWFDIQEVSGFKTSGWLMYAAEQTAGNSSWLKISSATESSISAGENSTISVHFDGANATRGDQIANVVIKSNDPENTIVKVPVKLHMNEAPSFVNVPESVVVAEAESKTIALSVVDKENDPITITAAQSYDNISYSFSEGLLSVVMNPGYGDAGNYTYTFIATDQYNASREVTLTVEVTHTNRAPVYSGADDPFSNLKKAVYNEYFVRDFFKDEDGDEMTFTAVSADPSIISVFSATDKFVVQLHKSGATELTFQVKDVHDAALTVVFPVTFPTNTIPVVAQPLADITAFEKQGETQMNIENIFSDEDGDALTYSVISADVNIASVKLTGTLLILTPVGIGETTVSITATDPEGASVTDEIKVTVSPAQINSVPVVAHALADITTSAKQGETQLNIENVFSDADGDVLTYSVTSANVKVASAKLAGTLLIITPVGIGETKISVTATDPDGASITDEIKVIVGTILGDINGSIPEVTLSPNPTNGEVAIRVPVPFTGQIRIMNYLGATLQVIKIKPDQEVYAIDLGETSAGVYLVELTDGVTTTVKRIIKN